MVDGRAGYRIRGSHDLVLPDACDAIDPSAEQLLVDGRFGASREVTIRVGNRTGERMVMVDGPSTPTWVRPMCSSSGKAGSRWKRAWIHEEAAGRTWLRRGRSSEPSGRGRRPGGGGRRDGRRARRRRPARRRLCFGVGVFSTVGVDRRCT
ncbi:MAG: hypothetical protein R2695_17575 [Acidimicrobiales bacterium]